MKVRDGCSNMSGNVFRLNMSLHGPNQSRPPRAGLLVDTVIEYGMEQCRTGPCVFRSVVRGKGRAPDIPVTKSVRINWRIRKHMFCWLYRNTY